MHDPSESQFVEFDPVTLQEQAENFLNQIILKTLYVSKLPLQVSISSYFVIYLACKAYLSK